ncbi:hypothetical protein [Frankia sp. AgB32]|uniref:hypothetical protein n=1 Tax=Frankia sp. AgB32 TaxID=631119 RepID=UPI00200D4130|nr:hypothetical protein [Frankia sp. AgB32]MCK9895225.1 hypothetical protein [Frankia sp. AgB32]
MTRADQLQAEADHILWSSTVMDTLRRDGWTPYRQHGTGRDRGEAPGLPTVLAVRGDRLAALWCLPRTQTGTGPDMILDGLDSAEVYAVQAGTRGALADLRRRLAAADDDRAQLR